MTALSEADILRLSTLRASRPWIEQTEGPKFWLKVINEIKIGVN